MKKNTKLTVFDIALAGIIMSLALISSAIFNVALKGRARIDIEIFFSILLGIVFGPIKGVFLSVLLDNLNLLIKGGIARWMWQYAITPALIPLLAYAFYHFLVKPKKERLLIIPNIITLLTVAAFFIFFFLGPNNPKNQNFRIDNFEKLSYAIMTPLISAMSLFLVATVAVSSFLYWKLKRPIFHLIAWLVSLVALILVLVRWIWGPIAFIDYWNLYLRRERPKKTYADFYYFYLTPIVFKSLITIPVYSYLLIMTLPIIAKLNKRFQNRAQEVLSEGQTLKTLENTKKAEIIKTEKALTKDKDTLSSNNLKKP